MQWYRSAHHRSRQREMDRWCQKHKVGFVRENVCCPSRNVRSRVRGMSTRAAAKPALAPRPDQTPARRRTCTLPLACFTYRTTRPGVAKTALQNSQRRDREKRYTNALQGEDGDAQARDSRSSAVADAAAVASTSSRADSRISRDGRERRLRVGACRRLGGPACLHAPVEPSQDVGDAREVVRSEARSL